MKLPEPHSDTQQTLLALKNEIWKGVPEFPIYEASSLGRIRSKDFISVRDNNGTMTEHRIKGTVLKHFVDKYGYHRVSVSSDKKQFNRVSHRLVAMAFHPNPENKPQVNHINGMKHDNRPENLEWCTGSENGLHAFRLGLRTPNKTGSGKYGLLHSQAKCIHIIDDSGDQYYVVTARSASEIIKSKREYISKRLNKSNSSGEFIRIKNFRLMHITRAEYFKQFPTEAKKIYKQLVKG